MGEYLVPTTLYVVVVVFGVVWIWLCGGFEQHKIVFGNYKRREDSWAKFIRECNARSGGVVIGEVTSWNIKTDEGQLYSGRGGDIYDGPGSRQEKIQSNVL